ncbi:MAG: helix-turn-helix domain-containing protein [Patescibacteria group bacterium]|nr:helix-turn-helix domain-containing protein [Patescibacteria group bacterium]
MDNPLTPKQKRLLETILNFYAQKGYSPTRKELAKKLKKSIPTIQQQVKSLIEKGFLEYQPGSFRNIKPIVEDKGQTIKKRKARIGIIGYGIVGQAVAYGFSNEQILIYDKYKQSDSLEKVCKESDYLFLCLPTPIKEDHSGIDLGIVNDNVKKINQFTKKTDKIIIIKSTVVPGTTRKLAKKYPQSLFCFNPEFLTEAAFLHDFVNPDRIVIGTDNDLVFRRLSSLYQCILPTTKIFHTDPTSAEMVKYMANCFLATKVIFANEMFEICQKLAIAYDEVKEMVVADKRIYDSHMKITSTRGFGGKCFPKDLLALGVMARALGADVALMDAVWKKNLKIRKVRDWEEIPFAVSKPNFGHRN